MTLQRSPDVDAITVQSAKESKSWAMSLTVDDEEVLISGGWLSDKIVNAAQMLIQAANPHIHGFQDVSL